MSDWIRVSCASLCRIEYEGRFLLLLNQNRRERGLYVLLPIGGALTVNDPANLRGFDVIPEAPDSHDLRFRLRRQLLPAFGKWFYSGQGRERSPFRELQEELVTESRLLPALTPEDVAWRYLWTVEEESFTMRQGQTDVLTHYYLEIYDITFNSQDVFDRLLTAPPGSGAAWVTSEQIKKRSRIMLHVDGAHREATVNGTLVLHPPPGAGS
ncbi:MAG: hypothetical protein JXJ20_15065 [Anaerolineae bacterium]|nr:hypothetical protein [Anaerolineae bacterium]